MDKRIEAALEILRSEYERPLKVPEIAKRVGLSRSHFEFLFRNETGFKLKVGLREIRLKQAADLLSANHTGVKRAAFSVGYHHVSNFDRDFRKEFGRARSNPQIAQTTQIRAMENAHMRSA